MAASTTVVQRAFATLASVALLATIACAPTQAPAPPPAPTVAPTAAPKPAAAAPTTAPTAAPKPAAAATTAPTVAPTAAPKPAATTPPAAAALTRVRYGLPTAPPAITTVGAYFALENGYFKDEGLDVEIIPYPGAVTAVRALLSRDAEIVMTGGDTAFLAQANGAPIKIISSPVAKGTDSVVVARDINSYKDLVGKQYAIANPGDTSHVTAKILAEKNGADPNGIDFVAVGGPADRARALIGGRVNASTMTILILQPILDAIDAGDVKVLTTLAKEFPDLPLAYNITRDDLVKDQPAVLTKFLKAEIKGYRWAVQNPEAAATIAEKYIKEVPHPLMTRGFRGLIELNVYGLDGGLTLEGIDRTQQLLVDLGALRRAVKADEVATIQFADAAVKDLGPAR
jgi:NitT/TauT family transport system substrate-binding protein